VSTKLENVKLNDLKQQKKHARVLVACSNFRTSCSIAWNYNTLWSPSCLVKKLRKKLLVVALMVTIAVSLAAYAWATYEGARAENDCLQVTAQLSSGTIARGDNVTIFALVEDEAEKPIGQATVTATIGDLEILFLLADQGDGNYQGSIDTSIVKQGTYTIVVTAQKEGYEPSQSSLTVTVTSDAASNPSDTAVTELKVVVNEVKTMDVHVCVDISDGVTEEEAELIVGTTFIVVIGEYVTHRLDTLTFDDTQIEAHYTWGVDENDMGHVFDMTADLTALQATVSHCF
jgi:hypothetical protein